MGALDSFFSGLASAASSEASAMSTRAGATGMRAGAVADLYSAKAFRYKAEGAKFEQENYLKAAGYADENTIFTREATAIKQSQIDREQFKIHGTQLATIASSGLKVSGSAMDLMMDSTRQGALTKTIAAEQGVITEEGYRQQADSYRIMAKTAQVAIDAANVAAKGAEETSAIRYQAADQMDSAATVMDVAAGIQAAGAIFSLGTALIPAGG